MLSGIKDFFGFQSTPSVWRETLAYYMVRLWQAISIHSLRVEGDLDLIEKLENHCISIHSLRVEGDFIGKQKTDGATIISIHSLRVEGDGHY